MLVLGCFLISVSVYYVAVRTIVLSRYESNLARPAIIYDIIHSLMCMPGTPPCGFSGISPDGNCAYVHWGSFTSNSKSVIWFTWFSEPHDTTSLAVPGGHPSNYEPGATLLNFSDRADTDIIVLLIDVRKVRDFVKLFWLHPNPLICIEKKYRTF